jgi:PAS domain S-box-containing protein
VHHAADAIIYADAGGVIRLWNNAATRVFSFDTAEAVGQSLDLIIPENLRRRRDGYHATTRTGRTRYGAGDFLAVPARRKDGTRLSVEFTILPFRDDDGHLVGIAAILRDVTRRFEEMKALRKQLGAAGETRKSDLRGTGNVLGPGLCCQFVLICLHRIGRGVVQRRDAGDAQHRYDGHGERKHRHHRQSTVNRCGHFQSERLR